MRAIMLFLIMLVLADIKEELHVANQKESTCVTPE